MESSAASKGRRPPRAACHAIRSTGSVSGCSCALVDLPGPDQYRCSGSRLIGVSFLHLTAVKTYIAVTARRRPVHRVRQRRSGQPQILGVGVDISEEQHLDLERRPLRHSGSGTDRSATGQAGPIR